MDLPKFRYHPDPVASGSVVASDKICVSCNEARGYIYVGPAYAEDDAVEEQLCPWCIADGSAHEKFDVSFSDAEALFDEVPPDVADEIEFRTPGFHAWQEARWLGCCGDGAEFRGPAGIVEIRARYPRLETALVTYLGDEWDMSGDDARHLIQSLDRDKGPTAYVFVCRHCTKQLGYVDQP
jgi:uncharacterized protein